MKTVFSQPLQCVRLEFETEAERDEMHLLVNSSLQFGEVWMTWIHHPEGSLPYLEIWAAPATMNKLSFLRSNQ